MRVPSLRQCWGAIAKCGLQQHCKREGGGGGETTESKLFQCFKVLVYDRRSLSKNLNFGHAEYALRLIGLRNWAILIWGNYSWFYEKIIGITAISIAPQIQKKFMIW